MSATSEFGAARAYGEAAMIAMVANAVPPTPQNFSVWYGYFAGSLPELKTAIDTMLANRQPFTPAVNGELYRRFFDQTGDVAVIQDTGGRLHRIVDQVRKHLDAAAGDATQFGRALDDFSVKINDGDDQNVRTLITDLVSETQRVAERNRALEDRLTRASGEVSELKQNLQHVQREAFTDGLTGISNRKSFDARLSEAILDAAAGDGPLSLLFADIDHFKRFNDTFGHQIGDQVLRLVARTLTDSVKGRDTASRYGGEEFAIILPQTKLDHARVVAEQIRTSLMRRRLVGRDKRDTYGSVTLSFGAAQFRPGESAADLVARADAALYHAKRSGRNRTSTEAALPPEVAAAS